MHQTTVYTGIKGTFNRKQFAFCSGRRAPARAPLVFKLNKGPRVEETSTKLLQLFVCATDEFETEVVQQLKHLTVSASCYIHYILQR